MERVFNILAGFTSRDDWLPDRFYEESIEVEGHLMQCPRDAFTQMHQEYYEVMGWDDEGIPTKETLKGLDVLELLPNSALLSSED